MKWLVRWLLASHPRFRPCDGCAPGDLTVIRMLAEALETREAADAERAKQEEPAF